jgi:polysaccharide biosynthesis protein PslJ
LNALGRFGYPQGGVLRYVEDNVLLGERAIGTWVDPNAYGGFLMMIGALTGTQILSTRPVTGQRWIAFALFIPVAVALLLTQSRGAWLALAGAFVFVAALRYRWLIVVMIVGGAILMSLPFMQSYVGRLLDGLNGEDLATQMRIGEYKDALTLIGRYPVIGVGFAGSPDRDIYLGVSSMYLKIAGATGLTGLSLFLLVVIGTFVYGLRRWKSLLKMPDVIDVWLGFAAGLFGAMISGVVDHYYFNIEFHGAVTIFWFFVGLSLAAARLKIEDKLA